MMTRRDAIRTAAGLAAGAVVLPALGGVRRPAPAVPGSARFFPWTDLGGGLHAVIDGETGGNCLLAVGEGGSLLVDTKFPAIGRVLLREASSVGGRPVCVVNTHHHLDHTGGNEAFKSAGVRIVAHARARERVAGSWEQISAQVAGGARFVEGLKRSGGGGVLDEAGVLAERVGSLSADDWTPDSATSGDETELRFGGRTAVLRHFGRAAHTDNDVAVFLPWANAVHTGDLVFSGRHPYFDPAGGSTARGWVAVLAELREACDAGTRVIPGHGAHGGPEVIDAQRAYLERLIEAVGAEVAKGTARDDVLKMTWGFMDGLGPDAVRVRAIGAVYDELGG